MCQVKLSSLQTKVKKIYYNSLKVLRESEPEGISKKQNADSVYTTVANVISHS